MMPAKVVEVHLFLAGIDRGLDAMKAAYADRATSFFQ